MSFKLQENGLYTVPVAAFVKKSEVVFRNVLFLSEFGSHLYGTATPQSDRDFKAVYADDLDNIILQKDSKQVTNVSSGGNLQNKADDVDIEFIELRKFLRDALKGQTYAIEMLFANENNIILCSDTFRSLLSNKDKILSPNVKPFLGYCAAQARKYGEKGKRLEEALSLVEFLNEYPDLPIRTLRAALKGFSCVTLHTEQGSLTAFDRTFPFGAKASYVADSLQKLVDSYGPRSFAALDGRDAKAIGHAFRVAFEVEELLTSGSISFPLKEAPFLLGIKTGEIPLDSSLLQNLDLTISDVLSRKSGTALLGRADPAYWDEWLISVYRGL